MSALTSQSLSGPMTLELRLIDLHLGKSFAFRGPIPIKINRIYEWYKKWGSYIPKMLIKILPLQQLLQKKKKNA